MVDSRAKGAEGEKQVKDLLRKHTGLPFERVPMSGALPFMKGDLFVPDTALIYCEDFALTILYNICNRKIFVMMMSILIGRSKICYTKSPRDGGHAVLRHRGLYTDNWQKEWMTKQDYLDKGYTFHRFLFWAYTTSVKLFLGYLAARKKEKKNG